MRRLALFVCLLACGKSDQAEDPGGPVRIKEPAKPTDTAKGPDAACAAKLKDFGPWLETFELEIASHEVDMITKHPVIERAAFPLERKSDFAIVGKQLMAYDSTIGSITGADPVLERKPKALVEHLKKMRDTPGDAKDGAAPDDQLRVDIDVDAPWSDVVLVITAAKEAGYQRLLFPFTAKGTLPTPAGVADRSKTYAETDSARDKLEVLQDTTCKPWGLAGLRHTYNPKRDEDARTWAREQVAAIGACNCAIDLDELKQLMWQHERWFQAVMRTRVIVGLGDAVKLELPGKTPWREAHAKLLAAAPEGTTPALSFVATK